MLPGGGLDAVDARAAGALPGHRPGRRGDLPAADVQRHQPAGQARQRDDPLHPAYGRLDDAGGRLALRGAGAPRPARPARAEPAAHRHRDRRRPRRGHDDRRGPRGADRRGLGGHDPRLRPAPRPARSTITPGLLLAAAGRARRRSAAGPVLVRGGTADHERRARASPARRPARAPRARPSGRPPTARRLLVTAEGPAQGRPRHDGRRAGRADGSLGAATAIAMDAGGSAQLAVRDELVIPWSRAAQPLRRDRALLPGRSPSSPCPSASRRTPTGWTTRPRWSCARPSPGATRGHRGPPHRAPVQAAVERPARAGAARVNLDPRRLRLADGVYVVVARHTADDGSGVTEQRRRVIIDRTLSSLNARATTTRVRTKVLRAAGRPLPPAAARPGHGARARRPAARRSRRSPAAGRCAPARQVVAWNRTVRGALVSGAVRVTVEARSPLGTSGLVRRGDPEAPPPARPPRPPEGPTPGLVLVQRLDLGLHGADLGDQAVDLRRRARTRRRAGGRRRARGPPPARSTAASGRAPGPCHAPPRRPSGRRRRRASRRPWPCRPVPWRCPFPVGETERRVYLRLLPPVHDGEHHGGQREEQGEEDAELPAVALEEDHQGHDEA